MTLIENIVFAIVLFCLIASAGIQVVAVLSGYKCVRHQPGIILAGKIPMVTSSCVEYKK